MEIEHKKDVAGYAQTVQYNARLRMLLHYGLGQGNADLGIQSLKLYIIVTKI